MKFTRNAALFAAAALAGSAALVSAADDKPSDVIDLKQDTFSGVVDPEPLILVEYFAPWCGHCQALAPHLEEAATSLLKEDNIKVAKVDCTVEEKLCADAGVGGYPTLKVYRKGSATDYAGPRKADGIISYMKKQALPAVSTVAASNLTEFKGKDRVVAVAFLSGDDVKDKEAFTTVAEANRDTYVFGLASDAATAEAAGVTAPALVLYRKFDEPEVKYTGKFVAEDIEKFLGVESIALVDQVGPENFMAYAEAGLPLAYLFVDPESSERESLIESLKPIAKQFRGKLNLVWIDAVKFVNHAKGLNLKGEEFPAFAIQDIQAATKYPLETLGKDVPKAVSEHIEAFVAGKLTASIKSEPVPKSQEGPVFDLVADEFEKVVFDDKKDVLLELYAPWCGHCKNLAPIYDDLGSRYAASKDKLVIAKMDATANDVPPSAGFSVQSFPTIKFKPAGSKEFIDYEGARTVEGFTEFLTANAKNKVTPTEPAPAADAEKKEAHPAHEEL